MPSIPPRPATPFAHPVVKNSPHSHSSSSFRRSVSAACALAASIGLACLPAESDAQVDSTTNLGVYLKRTEHQDGDGTKPITRNGNALIAAERAFRNPGTYSVGFWFKRDLVADRYHAGSGEGGRLRVDLPRRWAGDLSVPLVDSSLLPQDTDWHFVFLTLAQLGDPSHTVDLKVYLDGAPEPASASTFVGLGVGSSVGQLLTIGAEPQNATSPASRPSAARWTT